MAVPGRAANELRKSCREPQTPPTHAARHLLRCAATCAARRRRAETRCSAQTTDAEVVVIGAGIGGLTAAAMLAKAGRRVVVLESHSIAGGAAHAWKRDGFTFESGPSLYSGLAARPSPNPLAQVLQALGEELPVVRYTQWTCHLQPLGTYLTDVGSPDKFERVLAHQADGGEAIRQWRALCAAMGPLSSAAVAIPAAAVRADAGAILTLARFLPRLAAAPLALPQLIQPFSSILRRYNITHPFLLQWMDMLCFLLSGCPASGTITVEIAFMFADWFTPNSALEFPLGGSGALVDALVRGLTKHGGVLRTSSHVERVLVENGRAAGVRLRGGDVLRATAAVISNASIWDTLPLLPPGALPPAWAATAESTPQCDSFVHLHLGIDAAGLPPGLGLHHISTENWAAPIDSPQNLVLTSIASVADPSLAPPGHHTVHAYTPGTEPSSLWAGLKRGSVEYEDLKRERSQVIFSIFFIFFHFFRFSCAVRRRFCGARWRRPSRTRGSVLKSRWWARR